MESPWEIPGPPLQLVLQDGGSQSGAHWAPGPLWNVIRRRQTVDFHQGISSPWWDLPSSKLTVCDIENGHSYAIVICPSKIRWFSISHHLVI
jgi:hypothetical protein